MRRVTKRSLAGLWTLFLVRGLFYISSVPLWEGFDEWAHYAALQNVATSGRALPSPTDRVSQEVQASLELAPMPWQMTGLKHDAYWLLPAAERDEREAKLRSLPSHLAWEPAKDGERAYEAQQAPFYYWLFAPAYRLTSGLTLLTRVWLLRLLSLLVASAVIPLGFLVAREILRDDYLALGVAAIIASMPGLMMTVCHIGNDSLAVALGSLFLLALFRWKEQPHSMQRAVALGAILGLALLTKAYFLALLPPLLVFAAIWAKRKRFYRQVAAIFGVVIVLAAWWYARNWVLTHSLSGEQFDVAAHSAPLSTVLHINWLRAADFTFLSHIWLGNWSFLVVRSWMYHFFALVAGLACLGLIVRLVKVGFRSDLLVLAGIYLTFVLALGYHALRAFQSAGFPGALGYYLFSIAVAEVILIVIGLQTFTPARIVVPAGIFCFAALEFFGMCFYSIPYYTGFISHLPNGALPTLRIAQLQNGGGLTLLARLTTNKPEFLTAQVMAILWILFVAATLGLLALFSYPGRVSQAAVEPAVGEVDRLPDQQPDDQP